MPTAGVTSGSTPTTPAWLPAAAFAALAGIGARSASRILRGCHNGRPWRGHQLEVRRARGQRGGASGWVYEVRADSLPEGMGEGHSENLPARLAAPPGPAPAPAAPRRAGDQVAEFRLSVIEAVYKLTALGDGKDLAIRAVCREARYPCGARRGKPVGRITVYDWIAAYERAGMAGALRKRREDAGRERATISRKWDALVPDSSAREVIERKLIRRIKGEWHHGTPSARTIQFNVRPDLMRMTREAASGIPVETLRSACLVPLPFIRQFEHHRNVALYRNDAGRFAADIEPRARRDRSHLKPMEWVAADVHHFDILIRRDDGSLCTPKGVAWMDLATNRVFFSAFLMPKGRMISRREVAESFTAMCADSDWGVPTNIYADRGGEYNWLDLTLDLMALKHRVAVWDQGALEDAPSGLHRSLPYNPQSKVIETIFSIMEGSVFPQLPGHIGGDRMRKKTQNQGREPQAFPGDFTAFRQAIDAAVRYYHAKPQQAGHIAGRSPDQAFREFIDAGWQSITLDPANLAMQLCDRDTRVVGPGGCISWKNRTYRSDKLMSHAGATVTIGAPFIGDGRGVFVFDGETPLCVATPETSTAFDDGRGYAERQRQSVELRGQLRVMESEGQRPAPLEVMQDAAAAAGPVPHAESAASIAISPEHDAVAREYAELPEHGCDAEAERRAAHERKIAKDSAARWKLLDAIEAQKQRASA